MMDDTPDLLEFSGLPANPIAIVGTGERGGFAVFSEDGAVQLCTG